MWSQDRALKELRVWRQGNPQTGLWMADNGLARAALKYFGSINQAMRAAGVEPRPRGWSKQALIESIQDRHVRGLTLRDGVQGQDTALVSSAKRHFGSWAAALQAAGINVTWQRRWKKETVVKELQAWYREPQRDHDDWDHGLFSAATRYCGSWKQALQAAGLEPKRYRTWTRQRVIAAIQDRHVRGLPITRIERRNRSLVTAARYYFGGWRDALKAAGLGEHYQESHVIDWSK